MLGFSRFAIAISLVGAVLAVPAAAAPGPTLLGAFQNWSAFQAQGRDGKVCYVLSQPQSSLPKKAKRDPIYFLISDWPGRRAKAEPQIVPGYQYRPDSTVSALVGGQRFDFFTRNDGGAGSAWVKDQGDETRLIAAMSRASEVEIDGTSQRGTATKDTYGLAGLGDALNKIHAACRM